MIRIKLSEKDILQSCMQLLDVYKIFHWRNNSGAMTTNYKGRNSFVRFGEKGSPDIIAIHNRYFIGIECKSQTGKQSEFQKEFQDKVERAGGYYFLVRSSKELEQLLFKHKFVNL